MAMGKQLTICYRINSRESPLNREEFKDKEVTEQVDKIKQLKFRDNHIESIPNQ